MPAPLAASLCAIAIVGLVIAGFQTPVVGGRFVIEGYNVADVDCAEMRVGASDPDVPPTSERVVSLEFAQRFTVSLPAGDHRATVSAIGTKIGELGSSSGWRDVFVLGGCDADAVERTFAARDPGSAVIRIWQF